jgi:creatinine amidohydrolase
MENFPWTRLPGVKVPTESKTPIDRDRMMLMNPKEVREYLGDGNFAGLYQRSDEDMLEIWNAAVEETRRMLEGPWA